MISLLGYYNYYYRFYQDNVVVAEFRKEIQRADENQTTSSFQSQIIVGKFTFNTTAETLFNLWIELNSSAITALHIIIFD